MKLELDGTVLILKADNEEDTFQLEKVRVELVNAEVLGHVPFCLTNGELQIQLKHI